MAGGGAPRAGVRMVAPAPLTRPLTAALTGALTSRRGCAWGLRGLVLGLSGGLRGGLAGLLFSDLCFPAGLLRLVFLGQGAHVVGGPPR